MLPGFSVTNSRAGSLSKLAALLVTGGANKQTDRPPAEHKPARRWLRRALGWILLLLMLYQLWFLAWVLAYRWVNPQQTSFMSLRLAKLRDLDPQSRLSHEWVPYSHISRNLKRGVVAAEDARFVKHAGFDWKGIESAMRRNSELGRLVAGGSTISQQLAKNLFLSPKRSLWRKAQEAVITVMIEGLWDKKRILEVYLNVIEWGDGVYGAEAAARHYYGLSAAALGARQSARLASMIPRPRYYDKHRNSAGLARKANIILARMRSSKLP